MSDITTLNSGRGAPVGHVETADGPVFAVRADGIRVPLQKGDAVLPGDQLETGQGGAVSVTFADQASFSLGEKGAMAIDEFVYDPAGGAGSSVVSVMEGVFVFVSGQIAKTMPDAMMVKTPVMSIGVRGTKVAGTAGQEGQHNSVTLLREDDGLVGEIAITTRGGTQVLNQALQTVKLTSVLDVPPPPAFLSPVEVRNLYGRALDVGRHAEDRVEKPVRVEDLIADPAAEPVPIPQREAELQTQVEEVARLPQLQPRPVKFDPLAGRPEIVDPIHPKGLDRLSAPFDGPLDPLLDPLRILEPQIARRETDDRDSTDIKAPEITRIDGTAGDDVLSGTPGQDEILGYSGNDIVYGHDSADNIFGGSGDDAIYGGPGNDRIHGEAGADRLMGEGGDDAIYGGLGDDTLLGGDGNDFIVGGDGADKMTGGQGADTFFFGDPGEGLFVATNIPVPAVVDTITDFAQGEDLLRFLASAFRMSVGSPTDGVNFEKIVGVYDGTNGTSGDYAAGDAAFILDGDGNLCWDHNGDSAGYTVVANVGDPTNVTAADITLV
jgi:hypothetical protein